MKVEGLNGLLSQLEKLRLKSVSGDNGSVIVGYTQQYAIYVHENLQAAHKEGKTAKFLETPARELTNDGTLRGIVSAAAKQGQPLIKALLLAGLRLQRESQKIVPIDTGALRGSAFTRIDDGHK
jgi:hypothetical protein